MIQSFEGPYSYHYNIVSDWNSSVIGVYYCGTKTADNKLIVFYIGRAIGEDGIRGRLLQHLGEAKWNDVTHFGYEACDTGQEAINHEASEIAKYKPKHNQQGK